MSLQYNKVRQPLLARKIRGFPAESRTPPFRHREFRGTPKFASGSGTPDCLGARSSRTASRLRLEAGFSAWPDLSTGGLRKSPARRTTRGSAARRGSSRFARRSVILRRASKWIVRSANSRRKIRSPSSRRRTSGSRSRPSSAITGAGNRPAAEPPHDAEPGGPTRRGHSARSRGLGRTRDAAGAKPARIGKLKRGVARPALSTPRDSEPEHGQTKVG